MSPINPNAQQSQQGRIKQEQLAKNLTRLYEGLNGAGHKDMPKPFSESNPNKK